MTLRSTADLLEEEAKRRIWSGREMGRGMTGKVAVKINNDTRCRAGGRVCKGEETWSLIEECSRAEPSLHCEDDGQEIPTEKARI